MVKTITLELSTEDLEVLKNAANLIATIRAAQEDCQGDGMHFTFGNEAADIEVIKKAVTYISNDIEVVAKNM